MKRKHYHEVLVERQRTRANFYQHTQVAQPMKRPLVHVILHQETRACIGTIMFSRNK